MLDKENTNQGYLCGRLFATLVEDTGEPVAVSTLFGNDS